MPTIGSTLRAILTSRKGFLAAVGLFIAVSIAVAITALTIRGAIAPERAIMLLTGDFVAAMIPLSSAIFGIAKEDAAAKGSPKMVQVTETKVEEKSREG